MQSRERVRMALGHQKPDRTPVDLGSTNVSSLHIEAYRKLLGLFGLEDKQIQFIDFAQQLVVPCEPLLQKLGVDTRALKMPGSKTKKIEFLCEDKSQYRDAWGIIWKKPPDGLYYDSVGNPLQAFDSLAEIESYPWPDIDQLCSEEGLSETARRIYEESGCSIVGSCGGSILMMGQDLRGYEQFLVDLMLEKEIAGYILDRVLALRLEMTKRFLRQAGEYVDVIKIADDLGGQDAPLISMDIFREMIKPRTEKLVRCIKENSRAKVMYHCCGAMRPFIPDLIEIGVDILNPIQTQAAGMDPAELKREYGDRLVFWGGVDTQQTLTKGSPADVEKEVAERISQMGFDGGYVACASHNMQADVPPENIAAMIKQAKSSNQGEIL